MIDELRVQVNSKQEDAVHAQQLKGIDNNLHHLRIMTSNDMPAFNSYSNILNTKLISLDKYM